jgi:hypothetical protein
MFTATLSYGKSQDAPLLQMVQKMWYLYTMEFYSATKKNEILSLQGKKNGIGEYYLVKLARLRRPKVTCSSSYVDCRPKTNVPILWDTGHTKGRLYKGG